MSGKAQINLADLKGLAPQGGPPKAKSKKTAKKAKGSRAGNLKKSAPPVTTPVAGLGKL